MQKIKLAVIGLILLASCSVHAQISVNLNIGSQPAWGPSGYSEVDYYYLPDVESYYDIRASQFIFLSNGRWIRSRSLPRRYRNYNLYNGYKVVLNDYHGSRPYGDYREHKVKYYKGYRNERQRNIGEGNHNNHENHGNSGNHENNGNHGNSDNHGNNGNHNEGGGHKGGKENKR